MKAAYSRLLEEFPAVVCASKRLPPVSYDVVHHIVTHGPPIASKFLKLDGEKLAAAKAEFKHLQALQDNGLVIHAEKCVWGVQELEYLGHKISAAGVLPLPSHVAAIQDFPRPSIIKELQASWAW